jgi:hypothetical protein
MDAVVEWVDVRERLPEMIGYPVAAAVSGPLPGRARGGIRAGFLAGTADVLHRSSHHRGRDRVPGAAGQVTLLLDAEPAALESR